MNATDSHVCSTPLGTAHVYSSVPAIEDKRVQANTHAVTTKRTSTREQLVHTLLVLHFRKRAVGSLKKNGYFLVLAYLKVERT